MNETDIIDAVRLIAFELSCPRVHEGEVGTGTRDRIGKLFDPPRPLASWLNNERFEARAGVFLPTAKGEILIRIIRLLRDSGYALCHRSATEHEQAIERAAMLLPELCDRLKIKKAAEDPNPWIPIQSPGDFIASSKTRGIYAVDPLNLDVRRFQCNAKQSLKPSYRYEVRRLALAKYIKAGRLENYPANGQ